MTDLVDQVAELVQENERVEAENARLLQMLAEALGADGVAVHDEPED